MSARGWQRVLCLCRETDRDDDGRDGAGVGAGENAGAGPCDSLLAAWTWKRSDGGVGAGRQGGGVGDDRVCSLFSLTWSGGGDHCVWGDFWSANVGDRTLRQIKLINYVSHL